MLHVKENNNEDNFKNVHALYLWKKKKEFNFRPKREI